MGNGHPTFDKESLLWVFFTRTELHLVENAAKHDKDPKTWGPFGKNERPLNARLGFFI